MMIRTIFVVLIAGLTISVTTNLGQTQAPAGTRTAPARPASAAASRPGNTAAVASMEGFVNKYCLGCHNEKLKSGTMSLVGFDFVHVDKNAELAEKVIRKLRAGLMPPAGAARPDAPAAQSFVTSLEKAVDQAALAQVHPGRRPFQRLTRLEYARTIREMLDIDMDVSAFLPPDTMSGAFDNIADVQSFSATLMDGYMRAAAAISREALGEANAAAESVTYSTSRTMSQTRYVEGAPYGTRGGIVADHVFPADGEYTFDVLLWGAEQGEGHPDYPSFGAI